MLVFGIGLAIVYALSGVWLVSVALDVFREHLPQAQQDRRRTAGTPRENYWKESIKEWWILGTTGLVVGFTLFVVSVGVLVTLALNS